MSEESAEIQSSQSASDPPLKNTLEEEGIEGRLVRFGFKPIPVDAIAKLEAYCQALWKINESLNLTRHTNYDLFVARDLLDTLALSELIADGESVLDVGTGGGVPGVPLAILRPDLRVSICDSIAKKANAVSAIVQDLRLPVSVHAVRAQDVLEHGRFDTLVSRAVGSLAKQCNWFNGYWHRFHQLLTIKGPRWIEERAEARHLGRLRGIELRRVAEYTTPGTGALNVILRLRKPLEGEKVHSDENDS